MPDELPLRYSVVVPAYNERENLEPLLAELLTVLDSLGEPYEILLVDDGSDDGSGALLAALARKHETLRVLALERRSGQSAALAAGFDAARGEAIVTLDADLQNDPADIPRLLAHFGAYDLVCGRRRRRRDGLLRRASSRIANAVRSAVTGDGIRDTGCSLKVFRAEQARALPRFDGMHRFFPALLRWEGARVVEVDVGHRPRRAGRSKYGVRNRLLRGLYDLLGVRWLRARRLRYRLRGGEEGR